MACWIRGCSLPWPAHAVSPPWFACLPTCDQPVILRMPPGKPRVRVYGLVKASSGREDGRFFAPLRMTCVAVAVVEVCRPSVGSDCHPEEALSAVPGLPAAQYAAQAGTGRRQADKGSPLPEAGRFYLHEERLRVIFIMTYSAHPRPSS